MARMRAVPRLSGINHLWVPDISRHPPDRGNPRADTDPAGLATADAQALDNVVSVIGPSSGIGIATAPAAAESFADGLTWLLADHRGSFLPDRRWTIMFENKHAALLGRLVIVGFGSIGQGVLPLLLRHLDIRADQISIVTAEPRGHDVAAEYGADFVETPLT